MFSCKTKYVLWKNKVCFIRKHTLFLSISYYVLHQHKHTIESMRGPWFTIFIANPPSPSVLHFTLSYRRHDGPRRGGFVASGRARRQAAPRYLAGALLTWTLSFRDRLRCSRFFVFVSLLVQVTMWSAPVAFDRITSTASQGPSRLLASATYMIHAGWSTKF